MAYITPEKQTIEIEPSENNLFITVTVAEYQFHNDTLSIKGNPVARDPITNRDLGKLNTQKGLTYKLRCEVSHTNPAVTECKMNVSLKIGDKVNEYPFSNESKPGDIVEFIIYFKIKDSL